LKPAPTVLAKLVCLTALSGPAATADHALAGFVTPAAQLNHYQISAGKLAEQKATKPMTRAYAREAVAAASEAQDDLVEAAKADGVNLPTALDKRQSEKLEALKASAPGDFDAAYMSAQMTTTAAIDRLYKAFIKDGPAGHVRTYAEANYPQLHMMGVRAAAQASPGTITNGAE
jgi:putative membrane protein